MRSALVSGERVPGGAPVLRTAAAAVSSAAASMRCRRDVSGSPLTRAYLGSLAVEGRGGYKIGPTPSSGSPGSRGEKRLRLRLTL
jgi:hypothetical protein